MVQKQWERFKIKIRAFLLITKKGGQILPSLVCVTVLPVLALSAGWHKNAAFRIMSFLWFRQAKLAMRRCHSHRTVSDGDCHSCSCCALNDPRGFPEGNSAGRPGRTQLEPFQHCSSQCHSGAFVQLPETSHSLPRWGSAIIHLMMWDSTILFSLIDVIWNTHDVAVSLASCSQSLSPF